MNTYVNTNKLRGVIASHGDTQKELAKHIGIAPPTLNDKIHNKRDFKRSEMGKIMWRYNLSHDEAFEIFFEVE